MQAMSTIFPKVCLYATKYTLFFALTQLQIPHVKTSH
jgi:hypothetical protein